MASGIKRRKYKPSSSCDLGYVPECRDPCHQAANAIRRDNGAMLLKFLLSLYASCKITAKGLCVSCHHAALAEVPGADVHLYAMEPGQATDGNDQRHLDSCLPAPKYSHMVQTPGRVEGVGRRSSLTPPVLPLHEAIASETQNFSRAARRQTGAKRTTRTHWWYKLVLAARLTQPLSLCA